MSEAKNNTVAKAAAARLRAADQQVLQLFRDADFSSESSGTRLYFSRSPWRYDSPEQPVSGSIEMRIKHRVPTWDVPGHQWPCGLESNPLKDPADGVWAACDKQRPSPRYVEVDALILPRCARKMAKRSIPEEIGMDEVFMNPAMALGRHLYYHDVLYTGESLSKYMSPWVITQVAFAKTNVSNGVELTGFDIWSITQEHTSIPVDMLNTIKEHYLVPDDLKFDTEAVPK